MVTLFDYSFEFKGKRVRVNGELVVKKNVLIHCITYLLNRAGYHFNHVTRPMPAWYVNWRDMKYSYLLTALQNIVFQLEYLLPLNRINDYSLESDGFHYIFVCNMEVKDLGRVCKINLFSDQRNESCLTTLSSCVDLIRRWFEKDGLTNRKVLIC